MSVSPEKKKKGSKRNKDQVVSIVAVVTDGGDFGFNMCEACGETISSHPLICPFCGAKFQEGLKLSPPVGGTDF